MVKKMRDLEAELDEKQEGNQLYTKNEVMQQNKDLKKKIKTLESKVNNLEEQISAEAQERMLVDNANKKLEKKIEELLGHMRKGAIVGPLQREQQDDLEEDRGMMSDLQSIQADPSSAGGSKDKSSCR